MNKNGDENYLDNGEHISVVCISTITRNQIRAKPVESRIDETFNPTILFLVLVVDHRRKGVCRPVGSRLNQFFKGKIKDRGHIQARGFFLPK